MDDGVKRILEMLEEGKISSEEAFELMDKIKKISQDENENQKNQILSTPNPKSSNTMDNVVEYIKSLEIKEKIISFAKSETVTDFKDKAISIFDTTQTTLYKKRYELLLEKDSILDLYVNKSSVMLSESNNDCLFISFTYKNKQDIEAVEFLMENDRYSFSFDKDNDTNINYIIEIPRNYLKKINVIGKDATINLQNINVRTYFNVEAESVKINLDKVLADMIKINSKKLHIISKKSNIGFLSGKGNIVNFTSTESDFKNLSIIGFSGKLNLEQKHTVYLSKSWNVEYSKAIVLMKIYKSKLLSKRVTLNVTKGEILVRLNKLKFKGKSCVNQYLEDKDFNSSPNKVDISVTNFEGNVIIRNY